MNEDIKIFSDGVERISSKTVVQKNSKRLSTGLRVIKPEIQLCKKEQILQRKNKKDYLKNYSLLYINY